MIKDSRFKFRVWDSALQTYRTDFYVYSTGNLFYHHDDGIVEKMELVTNDRWTVEQCTGQKDETGTLIYEGDIVSNYNPLTDTYVECRVKWEEDAAAWVLLYIEPDKVVKGCKYASKTGTYLDGAYCTVIGNIHEGVKK